MEKELNWLFDYENLKVYQYKDTFKFSLDSILLAEYAKIKKSDNMIIDLCTGNAVIPLILNQKYNKSIIGVEIQPEIAELARLSVSYNCMENKIKIIEDNVINLKNYFPGNNFDVVLCNPPYFKYHSEKFINQNIIKSIARHEIKVSLEQIMQNATYLLKPNGRFYLVHVPERLDEIIVYANLNNLAIKKLQLISSSKDGKPIILLACLVKGGGYGVKIAPQLNIGDLTTYQNIFLERSIK